MTRWYEDIVIGEPFPLGSHTFTEAEIIAFGKAYDPLPQSNRIRNRPHKTRRHIIIRTISSFE